MYIPSLFRIVNKQKINAAADTWGKGVLLTNNSNHCITFIFNKHDIIMLKWNLELLIAATLPLFSDTLHSKSPFYLATPISHQMHTSEFLGDSQFYIPRNMS